MMVTDGNQMTPEQQVKMIIGDLVLQISQQSIIIEQLQAKLKELQPEPPKPE